MAKHYRPRGYSATKARRRDRTTVATILIATVGLTVGSYDMSWSHGWWRFLYAVGVVATVLAVAALLASTLRSVEHS